jgi:hypothetical protein
MIPLITPMVDTAIIPISHGFIFILLYRCGHYGGGPINIFILKIYNLGNYNLRAK